MKRGPEVPIQVKGTRAESDDSGRPLSRVSFLGSTSGKLSVLQEYKLTNRSQEGEECVHNSLYRDGHIWWLEGSGRGSFEERQV